MIGPPQRDEPSADEIESRLQRNAVNEFWLQLSMGLGFALLLGLSPVLKGLPMGPFVNSLALRLVAVSAAAALFLALLLSLRRRGWPAQGRLGARIHLMDAAFHGFWGLGSALEFLSPGFDQGYLNVMTLFVTGAISAQCGPKIRGSSWLPRTLMFAPIIAAILATRPEDWALLLFIAALGLVFVTATGVVVRGRAIRQTGRRLQAARDAAGLRREAALRGRFLRAVTHDLNQPIAALSHYVRHFEVAGAAGRDREAAAAARACLTSIDSILASIAQAAYLREELPDPEAAPVDVDLISRHIAQELHAPAEARGLALRVRPSGLTALADRQFLERAVRNLVHNAVRFTECGGALLAARRRGGRIEVLVCDTGPGLTPDEAARVFEPYYSAAASEGAGLGLAVARDLCRAMGGDLTVRSRVGRGSCFRIVLPRADAPDQSTPYDRR